ncbi:putative LRR receptor-like serine/threonine-protein kinase [Nymphaea thermarum]|nr:putative LRR receptor-like serine/threonine-protein kinase [Nymphaea thermarum]
MSSSECLPAYKVGRVRSSLLPRITLVRHYLASITLHALGLYKLPAATFTNLKHLMRRFLQGGYCFSYCLVRYPDDRYDRIWFNFTDYEDFPLRPLAGKSDPAIDLAPDRPPAAVLRQAITTSSSLTPNLTIPPLPTRPPLMPQSYYVIFYFAEVSANATRSFDFFLGNDKFYDKTINVPRESVREIFHPNVRLSAGSTFTFSLVRAPGSALPPLINAAECFLVGPTWQNLSTEASDVKALSEFQNRYVQLQTWNGDPCLPTGFAWEWLDCSTDATPRVTALFLSGYGLTGPLADFSDLTALQTIDLHNNSLNGSIPEFLGKLPNLKRFAPGDLPNFPLVRGTISQATQATLQEAKRRRIMWVQLLEEPLPTSGLLEPEIKQHGFSHAEIVEITKDFGRVLGEGGSGKVYYGKLINGPEVAVKVLKDSLSQRTKEFVAEAKLLMTVHHRFLVSFVGYCEEGGNLILLYEYMSGGNLRQLLSGRSSTSAFLTWEIRLKIALNVATGLDYLHSGCYPPIIHRDVKTTNILLNAKMEAKVADFGLSRAGQKEEEADQPTVVVNPRQYRFDQRDDVTQVSTAVAGTRGYIDPEYYRTKRVTKKSDVYSFGVVLLELITGRPPIFAESRERFHIIGWVTPIIARREIHSIADPRLNGQYNVNSMWKVADIALSCTSETPDTRPHMIDVVNQLKEALEEETCYQQRIDTPSSELHFSAAVPVNVDCGTSVDVVGYNGMSWVGDDRYVRSGRPGAVQNDVKPISPLTTLRYFPLGKKNCYSFPGVGQGIKILVRAWFLYGNYDGLSLRPTFNLLFNGNLWGKVNVTGTSIDDNQRFEMIYITKADDVSICLARTNPNDVPFINSLEIKKLEDDMYQDMDTNRPLYPADDYDRIWTGFTKYTTLGLSPLNGDGSNPTLNVTDKPPAAVLRQAITTSSTLASNLTIPTLIESPLPVPHYVTFYFEEVSPVNTTRSFDIFLDNQKFYSKTVDVSNGNAQEIYHPKIDLSTSSTFTLVRTDGSSLPPLINAAEFFMLEPEIKHGFPYAEIVEITNNFEKVIGEGGSGNVYYGQLKNGHEVAVKVLKNSLSQGTKEFLAEVKLLVTVHHKCLVSFVGYCEEGGRLILLYENMSGGNLRQLLSGKTSTSAFLTWSSRLQVALSVATGLDYLHSGCNPPIIHRDVKTSNILLNAKMEAKVADFGLSKAGQKDDVTQLSTVVAGTPGYIDPEYYCTNMVTKKSDVYSFGVVLFELMTGYPPVFDVSGERFHIVQWVAPRLTRGDIHGVADPKLKGQYNVNSMWKVADIAMSCTSQPSHSRPHMSDVVNQLKEAIETEMPLNVDCGTTDNSTTGFLGMTWVGDEQYVKSGQSATVRIDHNNLIAPLTTLQYFPHQKKNCYSFPGVGQGLKILVRAWFYYGNYDGLSSPPTFDLLFNGNSWGRVSLSEDKYNGSAIFEVVHVTKVDDVSVCLVRTNPNDVPFINSLEIKLLDYSLYSGMDEIMQHGFSHAEIVEITNNFEKVLGEGGSGNVYYGRLKNGNEVAVKVLKNSLSQGTKEFVAEMLNHLESFETISGEAIDDSSPQMLGLLCWVLRGRWKSDFLYEYMSGGNLRQLLSGRTNTPAFLTWEIRLQIALRIATGPISPSFPLQISLVSSMQCFQVNKLLCFSCAGLDYLHSGCYPPIIHRDVKTTNILLNERMEAKVADFGLSKAGQKDDVTPPSTAVASTSGYIRPEYLYSCYGQKGDVTQMSTAVAGTPGYIDPEYYSTSLVTKKSDVYSFGVVLFELITGHPPIFIESGERLHIVEWVSPRLVKGDIHCVSDPKLRGQYNVNSMWKVADIAMSCTSQPHHSRPHMSNVVDQLKEAIELENNYQHRTDASFTEVELSSSLPYEFSSSSLSKPEIKHGFPYSEIVEIINNFEKVIGEGGSGQLKNGQEVAVKVLKNSMSQGTKEFLAEVCFGFTMFSVHITYVKLLVTFHHKCLVSFVDYCEEGGHLILLYENMSGGNLRQLLSVPLNVDCGTTGETAGYLNMTWVGDEQYVKSGQSATVRIDNSLIVPLTTLRYFPLRKKNCYSFPGVGQGLRILVRAWFYYGNYDGLSSPPTFDLLFNGNLWSSVVFSRENVSAMFEMVHVTKVDDVSVCLARTKPNDVPFINSLEIKKLEEDMYASMDTDRPLYLEGRYAYASATYIRYPDDPYDRLWSTFTDYASSRLSPLTRSPGPSSSIALADRPPAAVLRQAITPTSSLATNMTIPSLISSTSPVPHYVTFYFVEMLSNASRSFDIYLDDQKFYNETVDPTWTVLEIFHPNISLSASSVFSLVKSKGSTLPPLISAAEFYMIVKALSEFQKSYVQLQAWSGDPCLPIGYAWEWVNCSSDSTPRHGFSHAEIVQITNNFEKVLGKGGSGNVYYGRLRSGTEVAVKVLKNSLSEGIKEFVSEAKLLMTVHHRCLVSFVGYCEEGRNLVLIYEYMSGGNLRQLLSGRNISSAILTWDTRLQIALRVATGLDYLHSGCYPPIIHRDVKTTNILLNARMEAKLADFGLSKAGQKEDVTPLSTAVASTPGHIDPEYFYSHCGQKDDVTQLSTAVAGTPGYIDPEYYSTNLVTKKSDVFSFGVVLLELITGHPPIFTVHEGRFHIVQWVMPRLARGDIHGIADPELKGQYNVHSMWKVADIAMSCTSQPYHSRPHMSNVVDRLKEAIEAENIYQHTTDTSFTEVQLSSSSPYEFSISSLSSSHLPPAR